MFGLNYAHLRSYDILADQNPLSEALMQHSMNLYIGDCCQKKLNLDSPIDATGDTLLHKATQEERIRIVSALLRQGADPLAKNAKGETPVYLSML